MRDMLTSEYQSMKRKIFEKCRFCVELFMHLRIVDDFTSFPETEGSIKEWNCVKNRPQKRAFSDSIFSDNSDAVTSMQCEIVDKKEGILPTDKGILEVKYLLTRWWSREKLEARRCVTLWSLENLDLFEGAFSTLCESCS